MAAKPVLYFRTQKECRAAIKAEVDPHKTTGDIFLAPITRDLLAKHHHGCIAHQLVPECFQWGIHPDTGFENCFYARFNDPRYPDLTWKPTAWNKAIRNWRLTDQTLDGLLKHDLLRAVVRPLLWEYRNSHPFCEIHDGTHGQYEAAVHVHHVHPTFDAIAIGAIALLSQQDRQAFISDFDWVRDDALNVPIQCRDYLLFVHSMARVQSVCLIHHKLAHYGSFNGDTIL